MNDIPRLSELSPDGFEADLIRAAKREAPSPALREATAASLAVAATLAPPAAAAGLGSKGLLALVAKGMIAGTLVTSGIVGVTEVVRARHSGRSEAPAASVVRVAAAVPAPSVTAAVMELPDMPPPPPPAVEETPSNPEEATEEAAPSAPSSHKTAPPGLVAGSVTGPAGPAPSASGEAAPASSVAGTQAGLSGELKAFERAHGAFSRGDMWTAEAALGEYRQNYPGGAFDLEARVLEIEILRARRQTPAMQARAREFLSLHPSAPAARRVRNLLEQSGEKAQ